MMDSFLEAMRRPKALGAWAQTSETRPGEHDPYAQVFDQLKQERMQENRNNSMMPRMSMGGGNLRSIGSGLMGAMPLRDVNDRMDVVYDQRPEMMSKQLDMQKRALSQREHEREQDRADDALKANDDYIDNRRKMGLAQRHADTADWAARNLKPGEMGDREKLQTEYNNRHALQTAENIDNWVARREANQGAERIAGIRGDTASENAGIRANAMQEAANIRAAAQTEAARIRTQGKVEEPESETEQPGFVPNPKLSRINPGAASDPGPDKTRGNISELNQIIDDDARHKAAAQKYGASNVPAMGGVGSAGLGGQLGAAGLRGNAPIDRNATATPYAGNASSQSAAQGGGGQVRYQTNAKTGQRRMSRDGGQTWQLVQ